MTFVILQEKAGRQRWIRIGKATSAGFISIPNTSVLDGRPPPQDMHYPDRNVAEHDAEVLRARNAHDVEATKRHYKYKEKPATYTVVAVADYEQFLNRRREEQTT